MTEEILNLNEIADYVAAKALGKLADIKPCIICSQYAHCRKMSAGKDDYFVQKRIASFTLYGDPCFSPARKEVSP